MNLLLINADQLRWDCVGSSGVRPVRTPNLDALALEGAVYSRAFTPLPVCAPARQAILSGRNPDSFGAQWNFDQIPCPTVRPEWCWPGQLRERGFQTAFLGGFHADPEYDATRFGYDLHINRNTYRKMIAEKYTDLQLEGGWFGCSNPLPVQDSATHWQADRACEVLRLFASEGKPWHIWVDFEEPHLPCRPSVPFDTLFDPAAIPPWDGFDDSFVHKPYCHAQQMWNWGLEKTQWSDFQPMVARYWGMITQLDDAIGHILRTLRECGQWEETVVLFTSDHGDLCGSHRMLDKHYVLYDDVTHVPLIARVPGRASYRCESFVSSCLDIAASIREWFCLPPPEAAHGRPLPLGQGEGVRREEIVSTSNGQQFGLFTARCLRGERWKYVWNLTDVDELYDLRDDPGELQNRIDDPALAALLAGMRERLHAALLRQGDPFVGNEWLTRQLLENRKRVPWKENKP